MRALRSCFGRLLLCGALLCACVTALPTNAYAEWKTVVPTGSYLGSGAVTTGNLKVSPIVSRGLTGYSSLIYGGTYISGSSTLDGPSYNTKPSGDVYLYYVWNQPSHLSEGNKVVIQLETRLYGVPSGATNAYDGYGTDLIKDNMRFFVSKSGNTDKQEIYLDNTGALKMPYDASYLFVTCRATNFSNAASGYGNYYLMNELCKLNYELPSDQNEVAAIETQTDTFMDTTGSNTVGPDAVTQGQQIVQGMDFVSQTGSFVTGAFDAIANADASEGLQFPGLTIMGYQIIAPRMVPFLGYLGAEIENQIKTFVTMVIFIAWLNGIRGIYHKIFLGEKEVEVVED